MRTKSIEVAELTWRADALCAPEPDRDLSEIFFPDERNPKLARRQEEAAKAVCSKCPVSRECLDFAIEWREPFGVWGGLNWSERQVIIKKRRRSEYGSF